MMVCETARLVLRRFTLDDVPALAAIHADTEVGQYIGGVRTLAETHCRVTEFIRDYERIGFAKWAVVLRSDGRLIGRCGPQLMRVESCDEVEVGYTFAKSHWGCGYATEAASAALSHLFRAFGKTRLISLIEPPNMRSQRVAMRLGMTHGDVPSPVETGWRGSSDYAALLEPSTVLGSSCTS